MSKHRVAVLEVVAAQLCVTAAAAECGISRQHLYTGEILSTHLIEPDKGYWRNQRRDPGPWPGSHQTG
jgi:hypothetical protein